MTLVVLTIVVIALIVAALAVYLFTIGGLLNRTADNLDDCEQSIKKIVGQVNAIGRVVEHINRTGGELVGALPLLYESAERIGTEPAAAAPTLAAAPEAPP